MSLEKVKELFNSANRHLENEDYPSAMKVANEILKVAPKNDDALHTRVHCLIKMERFAEVLNLVSKNDSLSPDLFLAEKAYACYRLNKFKEAMDIINSVDKKNEFFEQLYAQVLYRIGEYGTCQKQYEEIMSRPAKNVEVSKDDVLVNLTASYVSGDKAEKALNVALKSDAAEAEWVVSFNLACALIELGQLDEALRHLETAKDLCEGDAEEDDEQLELDLAIIKAQQAVIFQKAGRTDEASEIYESIESMKKKTDLDVALLACICNNQVALKTDGNKLFDSLKRINIASKDSLEHKLTAKQSASIALNRVLVLLKTKRIKDAHQVFQGIQNKNSASTVLVEAALAFHDRNLEKCEEILKGSKTPEATAALGELYSSHLNQEAKAMEYYAKLPADKRVEVIGTICNFSWKQKKPEEIVKNLRESMKVVKDNVGKLATLLKIAAKWALTLKDTAFAAEVFEIYLEQVDKKDQTFLIGLIQALSSLNPEKAIEYAERLTCMEIPEEWSACDPEELEQTVPKRVKTVPTKDAENNSKSEEPAKKKRKRKIRYPKGFDPENPGPPPDPERWLPKYERSGYKAKKKKGRGGLARGPQGAVIADDAKKGPSTAHKEVATETVARKGNKQKKKKK